MYSKLPGYSRSYHISLIALYTAVTAAHQHPICGVLTICTKPERDALMYGRGRDARKPNGTGSSYCGCEVNLTILRLWLIELNLYCIPRISRLATSAFEKCVEMTLGSGVFLFFGALGIVPAVRLRDQTVELPKRSP
jgi:hypothetical protein